MKIGLATEGTYPLHAGGVSVWCDQLINGLPEHEFHVFAACAVDSEPVTWSLPWNVAGLHRVPLWGPPPQKRRASRHVRQLFAKAHADLVFALTEADHPTAADAFMNSLEALYSLRTVDTESLLLSNESLSRLLDAWHESSRRDRNSRKHDVSMSFADALTVTDTITHFLRPLRFRPPAVDVVHAVSNGLAGLLGMVTKWAHGVPFVLTEHGVYLRERYLSYLHTDDTFPVRYLTMSFFRLLSGAVYDSADVIRPSSFFNQRWEVRTGAEQERLETIYNGIEPGRFGPSESEPALPTLTWIGRIDPLKDLHTLIRAFKLIVEELPEARLRLFGRTPAGNEAYRTSCEDLIAHLGLQTAVTFEGQVDESNVAYEAGHVYVLSSVSEGFPFTLLEAMASAKATVATDVGGVREAVGDSGLIVPARDVHAMARACLRLLEDDELRRVLGARARVRVHQYFTVQRNLDAYSSTYRSAVRDASSARVAPLGAAPGIPQPHRLQPAAEYQETV